ncbi:MAG: hypothetical protein ACK2UC_00370 [Anaerolineae bacterium]|jgi:hypothetical protein
MKTGRVRKKKKSTPKPSPQKKTKSEPAKTQSRSAAAVRRPIAGGRHNSPSPKLLAALFFGAFGVLVLVMILINALFGRKADDWVPVTQTQGQWTTTVKIWSPQVTREERWEADCRSDPQATVQPRTCISRDTEEYEDQVVDDYEEYAYNIYYEETYERVYEPRGTEFVVTQLGTDDWWDQNLHYVLEEELDSGSCQYTAYTTWVDDPDDDTLEIEVYLAECEVWDHVIVHDRVYEQDNWCACDVITEVELGQEVQQGTGASIRWPNPAVPGGGRTEQGFEGTVIFQGDDYTYTTSTDDLSTYQDYLTSRYYIGLEEGEPIRVSKNPER